MAFEFFAGLALVVLGLAAFVLGKWSLELSVRADRICDQLDDFSDELERLRQLTVEHDNSIDEVRVSQTKDLELSPEVAACLAEVERMIDQKTRDILDARFSTVRKHCPCKVTACPWPPTEFSARHESSCPHEWVPAHTEGWLYCHKCMTRRLDDEESQLSEPDGA